MSGQRLQVDALRHLISSPRYNCDELIEHYLVRSDGDDFLFAHALVQEGVYNSLLKARRAALHRDAAAWYGERDPVLRAEHLDRADDPAAPLAYHEAAAAAAAALRFDAALRLADRGIELVTDPATRCDLKCLRADGLRNLGATDEFCFAIGQGEVIRGPAACLSARLPLPAWRPCPEDRKHS